MPTISTVLQEPIGEQDRIQRNAIESWQLIADSQILLTGESPYSDEFASEYEGVESVPMPSPGLPYARDCYLAMMDHAIHDTKIMVNSDIVLLNVEQAIWKAERSCDKYLIIGKRRNVNLPRLLDNRDEIIKKAFNKGKSGNNSALDYFIFRGLSLDDMPDFRYARIRWDNWVVWKARQEKINIFNATFLIRALHQNHKKKDREKQKYIDLYKKVTGEKKGVGIGIANAWEIS